MSYVNELIDLYNKNQDKIGVIEYRGDIPYVLLPPFHTTVTAQITVTIDQNGNFMRAELVAQDDKMTIIPVTEKSGSRTAGKEPHPLCDNLRYLAGDYKDYYKDDGVCNELYMSQIEKWEKSTYSHEKVKAIYLYLKKATLIKDLVEQKIIKLNDNNQIDDKENMEGIVQTKAFVRFIIRSTGENLYREIPDECWKDRTLQDCYIKYVRSQEREKGMCYLTGNMESISYLHSKKIRNEGDGAKLISANDSQNFTYRGRFANREEAVAVGSETSQIVHNTLKWIIRKQGAFFDTMTIVTWESDQLSMPKWNMDTESIITEYENEQEENDWDSWDDDWSEEEEVSDGNPITAEKFYKALNGYGKKVDNTSNMILLAFDAATPGRLAMIENVTLDTARYLKNIEKWHNDCNWIHEKWKDGKRIQFWGMVGVRDIADILFGIENKGKLSIVDGNGKKLYAEVAKRLLPCIWYGSNIPYDYVNLAVVKASNPLTYKERKNWERVLTLACSMVKKNEKDRNKEEWNVALDKSAKDRSYLYGRLLAVADRIEYMTYDAKDNGRITNAKRYMSTFSQRPYETWKVIEENIQPYLAKLDVVKRKYYENLLSEICNLFDIDKFKENKKLDGLYLLGFHSQEYDLRFKKENSEEKKEEE
ncbi:type I-C CRISPR-associated protein Cas8c/Csd1 [Dorea longicatena]|uniref:Type I-C CRISPR-associated protein Cas8c/Csd1 n=1 Tax=Dorea longicatena TaxID=88431 RepID=A0A414S0N8_9FIRM|nr:type I-C CRISPR-associated protein Cas8c/Csd1 [Dorea longicatena]RHG07212.1 type I-C CRISPR-associated protein Cas8c/Csd1 [Dorea longicatena]